jgi:hypothetical protein
MAPAPPPYEVITRLYLVPSLGRHRLDRLCPLTAPRCTQALAAPCGQLTAARARYPGTDLILRYEVKSRPSPA